MQMRCSTLAARRLTRRVSQHHSAMASISSSILPLQSCLRTPTPTHPPQPHQTTCATCGRYIHSAHTPGHAGANDATMNPSFHHSAASAVSPWADSASSVAPRGFATTPPTAPSTQPGTQPDTDTHPNVNHPTLESTYASLLETLLTINVDRRVRMGLVTMRRLQEELASLSPPLRTDLCESGIIVVHVTGSNGKGSVCCKLARAFRLAGLRVGVYTSPHLSSVRERIEIEGEPVSMEEVVEVLPPILKAATLPHIPATFFELTTALAFACFIRRSVQVAIIEVGLGGRLDATNVVTKPALTVVTSIALEHTQWLGHTIESIAKEKCAIFKSDSPALIGPSVPLPIAQQSYEEVGARSLKQVTERFDDYDEENSNIVREALHILFNNEPTSGKLRSLITEQGHASALTHDGHLDLSLIDRAVQARPPARFQRLRWDVQAQRAIDIEAEGQLHAHDNGVVHATQPNVHATSNAADPPHPSLQPIEVILDVCHNPSAFERLFEKLYKQYSSQSVRQHRQTVPPSSSPSPLNVSAMVGFSSDKDYSACLNLLARHCRRIFIVQADSKRAAPVEEVLARIDQLNLRAKYPHCEFILHSSSPFMTLTHVLKQAESTVTPPESSSTISSSSPSSSSNLSIAKPSPSPRLILVCGTFFIMGDARRALRLPHPTDPFSLNEQSLNKG